MAAPPAGGGGGNRGGGNGEQTLTLAMKDGKLTGSIVQPGRNGGEPTTTQLSEVSMKDDMVMFSVERTFQDQKRVSKYAGKVEGDTMKGSVDQPGRDGAMTKRDFTATRAK